MSRTFRDREPWRDGEHRRIRRLKNIADGYSCPRWSCEADQAFLAAEIATIRLRMHRDSHHATSPVRLTIKTWRDPYGGKNRAEIKRLFHKAGRARQRIEMIRVLSDEGADHA